MSRRSLAVLTAALGALALAPQSLADDLWFPHPADATWTYKWSDSVYATTPTIEKVTVKSQKSPTYILAWTTDGLDNPDDAIPSNGTMTFEETDQGISVTDWASTPPPGTFPL